MRAADAKLERLRSVTPMLIDVTLRESAVGSPIGHTLEDKLAMLSQLREFGFRDIVLGCLDYRDPDELQVDDDFMLALRAAGADRSGCFALTGVGLAQDGVFVPSPSMYKLRDYGVPNTIHEICLSDDGMAGQYDAARLFDSLPASVGWLRSHVQGDAGAAPRILVNLVDGCDAFAANLERTCALLALLATLPIEGVTIEDARGTFLPFQVGAYVEIARAILPPEMKVLVHIHAGAGYENAAVMEALLHGADGAWAALPKRTAVNGHASLGELLANLARIGNPNLAQYRLDTLLPLATSIQERSDGCPVPDDLPVLGANAYRLSLSAFEQKSGRYMDLPPQAIGAEYRYRICPVVSDPAALAGRLSEITGLPAGQYSPAVLEQMVRLMRRSLRDGLRIAFDQPERLLALYRSALQAHTPP